MKTRSAGILWLAVACAVLAASLAGNPPGGVSWQLFFSDPASFSSKLAYLTGVYLWPALLSFSAIVLFQLQFRITMSGAPAAAVFAFGVVGSMAMLAGFRSLGASPSSLPGYVLGMALGYTIMARLYAVRMRTIACKVRVPWIVWRGNAAAVGEIDRRVADTQRNRAAPVQPGAPS